MAREKAGWEVAVMECQTEEQARAKTCHMTGEKCIASDCVWWRWCVSLGRKEPRPVGRCTAPVKRP